MTAPDEPLSAKPTQLPIFWLALLSMSLLWLSFPPVGFAWLAWLAPCPLILLITTPSFTLTTNREDAQSEQNSATHPITSVPRRTYWKLFFAGTLYWLTTFYFIPIPHPALFGGWLAVSIYMAVYTPMLVSVSRFLIIRCHVPSMLAVPIVWTGIEWIRCHFATGMGMVCLSHSQYLNPELIQVADLFGAYSLTFLMICFSTGMTLMLQQLTLLRLGHRQFSWLRMFVPPLSSVAMLVAVVIYGQVRLNEFPVAAESPQEGQPRARMARIALIQTSFDVVFAKTTLEEIDQRIFETAQLTQSALQAEPTPDLVVWPEGSFLGYIDSISDGPYGTTEESAENLRSIWNFAMIGPLQRYDVPLLAGVLTKDPQDDGAAYNAALTFDEQGRIVDRYFKQHLVMFGEYVPFADQVPMIQSLSPMGRNLSVGTEFSRIKASELYLAPSICFETTVPHLIRRQINQLEAENGTIDAMVNITNDGWFFGTSCLDFHLACNIFRAVEMRKDHLVCANTGLSAHIDPAGRIVKRGSRRDTETLICDVVPSGGSSLYRTIGDLPSRVFGYITLVCWAIVMLSWFRKRSK